MLEPRTFLLTRVLHKALIIVPITLLALLFVLMTVAVYRAYPPPDGKVLKNDTLLGGDYIAFYVGGRLFHEHPASLYDFDFQRRYRNQLLGEARHVLKGDLPFVYPPLVAAISSLYARLPLEQAFYLWALTGLCSSLMCLLALGRVLKIVDYTRTPLLLLSILGYVPFYLNTVWGGAARLDRSVHLCSPGHSSG